MKSLRFIKTVAYNRAGENSRNYIPEITINLFCCQLPVRGILRIDTVWTLPGWSIDGA
jgi:hypothetical protein